MRPSLVGLFLLKAIGWFVVCLLVWYQLGDHVTRPVAMFCDMAVAAFFPDWAEGVEQAGSTLTLLTTLEVSGVAGVPTGHVAVLSPEVNFLQYGYGLPLLLALLLASNARRLLAKAVFGAVALVPFQVWGVCFDWLKQVTIETAAVPVSTFARELIALSYQFGYLVLPATVPLVLWAMLDRRFLSAFILEATLEGETEKADSRN
jgi:hypothetical protein